MRALRDGGRSVGLRVMSSMPPPLALLGLSFPLLVFFPARCRTGLASLIRREPKVVRVTCRGRHGVLTSLPFS